MPYNEREHKVSNINYLNKDFSTLKRTLLEYAKTYFPNTYRDFNETSPGMMLIEMSAYVGDVLSFYIDQQYKEMMLPLAEERRNVVNIAKLLGYKVKPISAAYTTLRFSQEVGTVGIEPIEPRLSDVHNQTPRLSAGTQVKSLSNSDIIFETLDYVDFTITGSNDSIEATGWDSETGLTNTFTITKEVAAISGKTKEKNFTIGSPNKFLKLTLSEQDVIEIIDVTDSNGNTWYEVEYLAQAGVFKETHYTDDNLPNAYELADDDPETETKGNLAVPYSLSIINTSKKFIVEVNDDNTTTLVFGNGILKNGQIIGEDFLHTEQAGITIPGEPSLFDNPVDPLAGSNKSTLGETPSNVTITVKYRVGGGLSANVPSNDLTTLVSTDTNITVTNNVPGTGGSSGDTIEEIRHKASAHFAAQQRCVTKEDYEARILSLPAKYGNIAKVFVDRVVPTGGVAVTQEFDSTEIIGEVEQYINEITLGNEEYDQPTLTGIIEAAELSYNVQYDDSQYKTLDAYILNYDNNKNLIWPETNSRLMTNIKTYLDKFRIITDRVNINRGFIVNFGVVFDVVATRGVNKSDVKLRCIDAITDYFDIDRMQFRQPLYVSDLEYDLAGIDGVRSVNYVTLTQEFDYNDGNKKVFGPTGAAGESDGGLYNYFFDSENMNDIFTPSDTNPGYGFAYDFKDAFRDGVILPSITPSVFELKNPNENVKGIVR